MNLTGHQIGRLAIHAEKAVKEHSIDPRTWEEKGCPNGQDEWEIAFQTLIDEDPTLPHYAEIASCDVCEFLVNYFVDRLSE